MLGSKPVSTPLVVGTSLTANDDIALINATMYRQVISGLHHPHMTKPDIFFYCEKLSQFMYVSSEHHWGAIKRLLRYLNGTRSLSIRLLADTPQTLRGFSDADWASNPYDHTSTSTFLIFLGANPISTTTATATELQWVKLQWVKLLLSKLLIPRQSSPTLFSDNLGVIYLSTNPVFHSLMKHLAIDYHFVCDLVQSSELHVTHVSAGDHLADALTKSLSRPRLLSLCNKVVLSLAHHLERAY